MCRSNSSTELEDTIDTTDSHVEPDIEKSLKKESIDTNPRDIEWLQGLSILFFWIAIYCVSSLILGAYCSDETFPMRQSVFCMYSTYITCSYTERIFRGIQTNDIGDKFTAFILGLASLFLSSIQDTDVIMFAIAVFFLGNIILRKSIKEESFLKDYVLHMVFSLGFMLGSIYSIRTFGALIFCILIPLWAFGLLFILIIKREFYSKRLETIKENDAFDIEFA